jgi:hypothetical protein
MKICTPQCTVNMIVCGDEEMKDLSLAHAYKHSWEDEEEKKIPTVAFITA